MKKYCYSKLIFLKKSLEKREKVHFNQRVYQRIAKPIGYIIFLDNCLDDFHYWTPRCRGIVHSSVA